MSCIVPRRCRPPRSLAASPKAWNSATQPSAGRLIRQPRNGILGSIALQHVIREGIEKRRESDRHPVGAIRESPLHNTLYPSFGFVYTLLAAVSTQHGADSPPVRVGAAFSMLSIGTSTPAIPVVCQGFPLSTVKPSLQTSSALSVSIQRLVASASVVQR